MLTALVLFTATACDSLDGTTSFEGDNEFQESIAIAHPATAQASPRALHGQLRSLLASQSQHRGLSYYRLPASNDLNKLPQDPKNPLTDAKVLLGQLLYHETALAVDNVYETGAETYSCASCHFAQAGFQANLPQGIAEGGVGFGFAGEARAMNPLYDSAQPDHLPDVQPIRSPSTMNAGYQELMLWNGQFGAVGDNIGTEASWIGPKASNFLGLHGLETQAHAGLEVHRMGNVELSRLAEIDEYRRLFHGAFPSDAEPVSRLNAALAIAAFERTVMANHAPFQRWLRGDKTAMSESELRGALLFFGTAECSACHTGPALNSMSFHALGMKDLDGSADPRVDLKPFGGTIADDVRRGRGGFTGREQDNYTFKTPQLYNLKDSPFFGHGASFTTVREVVEYKNAGIPENSFIPSDRLSPYFRPLGLTQSEIDDLVRFIEDALYDPYLMRYVPASLPSGNCTPVNDPEARIELGCEPSGA